MMKSRLPLLLVCIGLLAVALMATLMADWLIAFPVDAVPDYVGRQTCAECHEAQYHNWQNSPHDKAMDLATEQTVLGDFNDQAIEYAGVTSRMFQKDDKYFVHTEGPDGKMADFEVKYVFGFDPLQQYMVEFPDGRVQVLRISWDTLNNRWFYLYPPHEEGRKLAADDLFHWTRHQSNWNNVCADCHSTNVLKNYDLETDSFQTTFAEIDVSCETCHGPGSMHVELARSNSLFWDRNHGYGLAKLKGASSKNQIESCAKCHARRDIVYPDYRPGGEFLDYYSPSLLRDGLYYPDGQILDEVYVYGSYLQSKMHAKGIRCTDCHDPHTTRLKHQGNKLCTSCHQHPAGTFDVPAHHHHKPGSPGAQCVACHMPEKHYMIVDPRRDHSLRVPRPDLSIDLGTPNACTACHFDTEKSEKWDHYGDWMEAAVMGDVTAKKELDKVNKNMLAAVKKWYPSKKDKPLHYAYALQKARDRDPEAEEALTDLLKNKDVPAIVKATAIWHLTEIAAIRQAAGIASAAQGLVIDHVDDPNPLIRATAVQGLQQQGYDAEQLVKRLAPLLNDPVRRVRLEVVQSLAPYRQHLNEEQKIIFDKAIEEYRAGQLANQDHVGPHVNLGYLALRMGDVAQAIKHYESALRMDPSLDEPRLNLG
ncbi:MAG: HEAT repeat domain-containing protein, partial [Planctomycetales bacterium]